MWLEAEQHQRRVKYCRRVKERKETKEENTCHFTWGLVKIMLQPLTEGDMLVCRHAVWHHVLQPLLSIPNGPNAANGHVMLKPMAES